MNIQDKVLHEIDSEAYVNDKLIETVDTIIDESVLDDSYTIGSNVEEQELRHISELWRISDNMDKHELATICARAVRKYPLMVLHVIGEYIIEVLKEGDKRK